MTNWLLAFSFMFTSLTAPFTSPSSFEKLKSTEMPLAKAHAHNDYQHKRPLLDALERGFTSAEADVWLVDGKLLVAGDRISVQPEKTLESLYLLPLQQRIKNRGGSVYQGSKQAFTLWINIKSEENATYRAIHEDLQKYKQMLTAFTPANVKSGAVSVYISGNRPRKLMENEPVRYAAFDGRISDLGSHASAAFMPVISDSWTKHFTWMGIGKMPEAEKEKLYAIVQKAHESNRKIRFWSTMDLPVPRREAVWQELLTAGVDFINTNDLNGLQKFLTADETRVSEREIT